MKSYWSNQVAQFDWLELNQNIKKMTNYCQLIDWIKIKWSLEIKYKIRIKNEVD